VKAIADKQKNRNPSNYKLLDLLCQSMRNKGDAIKKKQQTYATAYLNKHVKKV